MKIKRSHFETLLREIVRETIQQLNEAERGEWWIYPGGDAQFADGDVGDSGHEGYVIEYITREIHDHFLGETYEEYVGYLNAYEDSLFKVLMEEERLSEEEIEEWKHGFGPTEILEKKLLEDKVYFTPEQASDAVMIAWGSSSKDARDYAMKYLGWKRMTTHAGSTYIQTWNLTQSDLDTIKRGIWDAWGYDDSDDEDENSKHVVYIEVRANNREFNDIPLEVLDKATVQDIIPYLRRSFQMREKKKVAPVIDPVNFTPVA